MLSKQPVFDQDVLEVAEYLQRLSPDVRRLMLRFIRFLCGPDQRDEKT